MRRRGKDGSESPGISSAKVDFPGQTVYWPRNLPQERYNSIEPVPKEEIPANEIEFPRLDSFGGKAREPLPTHDTWVGHDG